MQTITKTPGMERPANQHLRQGVAAANTRHHSGACFFVDNINHSLAWWQKPGNLASGRLYPTITGKKDEGDKGY